MKTKRILSLLMTLALCLSLLPGGVVPARAAGAGITWNETGQRYEISDYAGLLEFAAIVNGTGDYADNANPAACARLTKNIDASASATTQP